MKLLRVLSLNLLLVISGFAQSETARLAIIIDDLGNSLNSGLSALALPGQITYAILPHRKHSQFLAERAKRLGKEIMLHAPMSTLNNRELGAGALLDDLLESNFKQRLRHSINSLPHISGVNNHMGSRLTQNPIAMNWVMEVLEDEQLYFVDSRTTHKSVAYNLAKKRGLATASRDIFLDHKVDSAYIHKQFKRAIAISQKYGSAIAIAHPHKKTLVYLQQVLPTLSEYNIQLLSITELMAQGIEVRPMLSGIEAPANIPSLDLLVKYLTSESTPAL